MTTPTRIASNIRLGIFTLFCLFAVVGCRSSDKKPESLKVPRLMVESRGVNYGGLNTEVARLPISGTKIALRKEPLVSEFEIVNAELVRVELGLALLLELTERGARELYRGTVTNMGGRIVLTINDNPVGARRIDGAIEDGKFYTFVELEDEGLGDLVLEMKETLFYLQTEM